jgi:putative phosphoesterase
MRIGLLSDAHGNSVGLAACLDRLKELNVDRIYFLGDAVGYLPAESEVLALLRSAGVICQKGNHEAMLLGEISFAAGQDRIYGIERARARLSETDRRYIAEWPNHRVLELSGRKILFVHGSPVNYLEGYIYPDNDFKVFEGLPFAAVFMGHTHRPFISRREQTLIVNVGSCGIPRDQGDLLSFAVYDSDSDECEILRLRFDARQLKELYSREQVAEEVYSVFERRSQTSPFGRIINGGVS